VDNSYEIEKQLLDELSNLNREVGELKQITGESVSLNSVSVKLRDHINNINDIIANKLYFGALRASEEKYKALFESANDAIFIMKDDLFIDCNAKTLEMFGCERDQIVGRSPFHLSPEYQPDGLDSKILAGEKLDATQAGKSQFFEWRHRRPDGSLFDVEVSLTKFGYNSESYILAIVRDITRRKQAERTLRERENRLNSIFRAAPAGIGLVGDRIILDINDRICEMTGYARDELIGKTARILYPSQEEFDYVGREKYELIKKHGTGTVETRWLRKDGVIIDILLSSTPLDPEDLASGVTFTALDITERKRAEEALKDERDRAQKYLDIAGVIFVALDQHGAVTLINKKGCQILGYEEHEIIGKKWFDTYLPSRLVNEVKEAFGELMMGRMENVEYYENPIINKQAQERLIAWHNAILTDEKGAIRGTVSSGEDITERKLAEEALKQAFAEIESLKNRLQAENIYLQEEIKLEHNFSEIITNNSDFKKVLNKVEQVAATNATVLILGETGTGKELIARAVHNISPRRNRPLVKLNCAALPPSLIESELFGHEKGAFTGAVSQKIGRFELADGGTIFLDEIGDLPLDLQTKLLRVLQEGEFERVGGRKTIKVDVRVLAATNRNLKESVKKATFREDLYYRLNVFPIVCPLLNERKDDIPHLVTHFVKKAGKKIGKNIKSIPKDTMDALQNYNWPGNIRELENIIERAVITSSPKRLKLTGELIKDNTFLDSTSIAPLEEYERDYIIRVLEKANWRVSGEKGAAKLLGLNPKTLESRMKKLNIRRNN